ncbi:MAG: DUF4832 domain-containing protein [Candidatus Kaiserbacteria bacterium]|nr:DUF4832 domain-containing protein [Candidatus Kaiserbacteria bacterium]MCB9816259.1 DUF4832 domain-containing protein [Candidatus Nomurabacteria bacterium]
MKFACKTLIVPVLLFSLLMGSQTAYAATNTQLFVSLMSLFGIDKAYEMWTNAFGKAGSQVGAVIASDTTDLVAHWTFDDGAGTTADDAAGTHDGSLINGPVWSAGKFGSALTFDGVNDYVQVADSADFTRLPLSVSLWFKLDSLPSAQGDNALLIRERTGSSPFYTWSMDVRSYDNKLEFQVHDGSTAYTIASNGTISTGVWYHAVATMSSTGSLTLHLNGTQQTQTANFGSLNTATANMRIGAGSATSHQTKGAIDAVRIYSKVLSGNEIAQLYSTSVDQEVVTTPDPTPTPTVPEPVATIAASASSVVSGGSSVLTWSATDATTCSGSNFSTSGKTSGSASVSPTSNTTYRVTCTGAGGSDSASVSVSVSASTPTPTPAPITPEVVTFQTVNPVALSATTPLSNPGIGLEQAGKVRFASGKWQNDANTAVNDVATIRYVRIPWVAIEENGDNNFNWTVLDSAINAAVTAGKQIGISVMGQSPILGGSCNLEQPIPDWYMAEAEARGQRCTGVGTDGKGTPVGCTYYLTDFTNANNNCAANGGQYTNVWTFNHADPEYIAQQVELIDAIRNRYDKAAWAGKIAYIDVRGGLGAWSELHTENVVLSGTNTKWPMPNNSAKIAIADAYLKFNLIPIVANVRNGETAKEAPVENMWVYLCQQAAQQNKTIGWRTDGIDVTKWVMDPVFNAYPFMNDCWKYGPVYGEPMSGDAEPSTNPETYPSANGEKGYYAFNNLMEYWHFSGFNNKYHTYPGTSLYKAALDEWRSIGGYRLAVTEVTIPKTAAAGDLFTVSAKLKNTGTAPVYRDYYTLSLRFDPRSGGNDIIVPLSGDITQVFPGEGVKTFSKAGVSLASSDTYDVSIGVVQNSAFTQVNPLKLAHRTSDCEVVGGTYWCDLGSVTVSGTAVPTPTYACSDSSDNDGDGLVDYPADPGCTSGTDNDEYNSISTPVTDQIVTPTFSVGTQVRVQTGDGTNLNVRSSAGGTYIGWQVDAARGVIIGGPTTVSGQVWWSVDFNAGVDGWVVEEYLTEYTAPTPAPSAVLSVAPETIDAGESAIVTWSSTNANTCTGTGFSTGGAVSGSKTVAPDTTTTYTLVCSNAAGEATTNTQLVVIEPDTTAPSISNVQVIDVSKNSVRVTWNTDELTTSVVRYGKTLNYGSATNETQTVATDHSVTVSGLSADTAYHIQAVSRDAAGNQVASADMIVTTLATEDQTDPIVRFVPSETGTVSGTISLVAYAYDPEVSGETHSGMAGVQFKLDGSNYGPEDIAAPYERGLDTTAIQDGTHTLQAVARDKAGNIASSPQISLVVDNNPLPPPDVTDPVLTDVAVNDLGYGQYVVVWNTDEPATSLVRYGTSQNSLTASLTDDLLTTAHELSFPGLKARTTYYYAVTSEDAAGNTVTNNIRSFRTSGTLRGVWNLSARSGSVILSWDVDVDADSVLVFRTDNGTQAGPSGQPFTTLAGTETSYHDESTKKGVGYTYTVYTVSAEGEYSEPVSVTYTEISSAAPKLTEAAKNAVRSEQIRRSSGGVDRSALQQRILELTALIQQLQAQLQARLGTTNTSVATRAGLTRALGIGMEGDDVRRLQQALNARNFLIAYTGDGAPGYETTYFGQATLAALKRFQCEEMGICSGTPDTTGYGNVGPTTRAKLNE